MSCDLHILVHEAAESVTSQRPDSCSGASSHEAHWNGAGQPAEPAGEGFPASTSSVDPLTGTERVMPADSSTAAIRRRGEDGASPNGQRLPSRGTPSTAPGRVRPDRRECVTSAMRPGVCVAEVSRLLRMRRQVVGDGDR
jgi:hypothetical protein